MGGCCCRSTQSLQRISNQWSFRRKGEDFFSIIFRNTIVTLWIISAIFVGKIMLYVFAAINGICLGLLMSKFSTMKYLLLVLPHGIIEMGSFFLMCDTILNIIKKANIGKKDVSKIMIAYILLIVAVIIETFFTPVIWDIFSSYIYFSGLPYEFFCLRTSSIKKSQNNECIGGQNGKI